MWFSVFQFFAVSFDKMMVMDLISFLVKTTTFFVHFKVDRQWDKILLFYMEHSD